MNDPIAIIKRYPDGVTYWINGTFHVDGIEYDIREADIEVRPMLQLYDDGARCRPSRWSPVPVTDEEMRVYLHSGMLDGKYQP